MALVFIFFKGSVSNADEFGYISNYGGVVSGTLLAQQDGFISDSAEQAHISQESATTTAPKEQPHATSQEDFVIQSDAGVVGNIEASSERGTEVTEYTVQDGDVLTAIGFDYGVTIKTIIWANNLKDPDKLKPGTVLKIPPIDGVVHIVKSGDTVDKLAKMHGVEASKIIEFNGLPQEGNLRIGDEIMIPGGVIKETTGSGKSGGKSTTDTKRFAYLPTFDGYFILPVGQASRFGRNRKVHGRNGIDIDVACGTPVYSAAPGVVASSKTSGWNGGAGKMVLINHDNGTQTFYAHLSEVGVTAGTSVDRGQFIGRTGTTGNSTGCHLHLEFHGARNVYAAK